MASYLTRRLMLMVVILSAPKGLIGLLVRNAVAGDRG